MKNESHPGFCGRCVWRNGHNPECCFSCTKLGAQGDGAPSGFIADARLSKQQTDAQSASKNHEAAPEKHPGFCGRCSYRIARMRCWCCILGRDGAPREFLQDPKTETETAAEAVAEYDGVSFESQLDTELAEIRAMLVAKNRAYGDSVLNPIRLFSVASRIEQLNVRIDDKLSRIRRGLHAGEDVVADLIGYLVMLRIATRRGET